MGLEISCEERYRDFTVKVGMKRVGMVRAFSGFNGKPARFQSYIWTKMTTGWENRYLNGDNAVTMRAATNRILEHLGYGSTRDITSRQVRGIRTG